MQTWSSRSVLFGLLPLLSGLVACSDLQPIEPNQCGNRIIDVGEACDEGGATTLCTAECRLSCVATGVGPATYVDNPEDSVNGGFCPGGQACGVDGLCAAPSGKFRAATAFEFDITQAEVGDVDADGIADLIGTTATELRVQFGDDDGAPLASLSALPAPSATGPFLLGDFDGLNGVDLIVPGDSGVVPYYATSSGTLQHRPTPTLQVPREGGIGAVDGVISEVGGPRRPVLLFAEPQGNFVALRELLPAPPFPELARCDTGGPVILRREPLPTAKLGTGDLVALAIDRPTNPGVCVFSPASPTTPTDPGWLPRFYPLPAGARFDKDLFPLLWANLDGDNCPELLVPALTGASTVVHALYDSTAAGCSFTTANVLTPTWTGSEQVLAAGNLDRVGVDELVTQTGVFRVESMTALARLSGTLGMDRAQIVDINGDGAVDIVGTDLVGPTETRHELIRILRTAGPPGSWQSTNVLIETLRPVEQFVVGDYDGDRITDIALTEAISYNAARVPTEMAVSVVYGQRSEIPKYQVVLSTVPVLIGTLGQRRGTLADQDAADDLGVVVVGTSSNLPASVLYGSPQRSLTAPLALPADSVAAVAAGPWANGDTRTDLVVYSPTKQYLWPQVSNGFQIAATGTASTLSPGERRDFAIATATTTGGSSTVVSMTPSTRQAGVGGVGACATAWTGSNVQSAGARPALQVRDLDGAVGDEILLTSQPGLATQPIYLFSAIGPDCKLGTSVLPAGHPLLGCDAATVLEASATAGADPKHREILAVCRPNNTLSQLVRFELTDHGYQGTQLPVKIVGRARRLMSGDFTGDGLEDAVSITTVGAVDFATLLVQCAQTDTACDP